MFGVYCNNMFVFVFFFLIIILCDFFNSKVIWFCGIRCKNDFLRVIVKCIIYLVFCYVYGFFSYLVKVVVVRCWIIKVVI